MKKKVLPKIFGSVKEEVEYQKNKMNHFSENQRRMIDEFQEDQDSDARRMSNSKGMDESDKSVKLKMQEHYEETKQFFENFDNLDPEVTCQVKAIISKDYDTLERL